MERLVIYDAAKLDCAEFYRLDKRGRKIVVGERQEPLNQATVDETTTIAAIFTSSHVDRATLARMPKLRLIVCLSTGTDHVDLGECAKRGITVCNVPSYGEQTVAEYAIALMLALTRRIPEAIDRLRQGTAAHADLVGNDLGGRTLTVVGTGRIGRNVARFARVFGLTVLGVDPYPNHDAATELGFSYVGLHEGLKQADIVSLHAPATPENHHLINRRSLDLLKPSALLINTARGSLVDTTALLHALHTGQLAGAALDVIEGEALLGGTAEVQVLSDGRAEQAVVREIAEHEALLKLPNVILTNHNAYNTRQAHERIAAEGVAAIAGYLSGQPVNVIAPPRPIK